MLSGAFISVWTEYFGKNGGLTGVRTRVAGFKVPSANHYTIRPVSICRMRTRTDNEFEGGALDSSFPAPLN